MNQPNPEVQQSEPAAEPASLQKALGHVDSARIILDALLQPNPATESTEHPSLEEIIKAVKEVYPDAEECFYQRYGVPYRGIVTELTLAEQLHNGDVVPRELWCDAYNSLPNPTKQPQAPQQLVTPERLQRLSLAARMLGVGQSLSYAPSLEEVSEIAARLIEAHAQLAAALEREKVKDENLTALQDWWNLNPSLFQHRIAEAEAERDRLREALEKIREECFDDSEWAAIIDGVLSPMPQKETNNGQLFGD